MIELMELAEHFSDMEDEQLVDSGLEYVQSSLVVSRN